MIATTGGGASISAAKASTATIPVVFSFGGDPVLAGFVASLNRPGGNITGSELFWYAPQRQRIGTAASSSCPKLRTIGLLTNPKLPEAARAVSDAQEGARLLGRQLLVLNASASGEIDTAFSTLRQRRADAVLVGTDPYFSGRRQQIVALAARDAIPAMYFNREFVEEGGLMSYGNDILDLYRRCGFYTGRILKGENPAELPIDQATRFAFVINLKTAKALGLEVPSTLLVRADEVIE